VGRLDEPGLRILAENHVGPDKAEQVLAAERAVLPKGTPTQLAMALINHRTFLQGWSRMAEERLKVASAPTWLYRFDYTTSVHDGLWGAVHGGEFSFFLNNVDGGGYGQQFMNMYVDRPDRHDLQTTLNEAFVRFATDGDPRTTEFKEWHPYDLEKRATAVFDSTCGVLEDPDPVLRQAYKDVEECAGPGDYRRALRYEGFAE
jgi:para-nitrobenzyl esterase